MKRYAVAFISFHDNELTTEIIEANTWQEALEKHSQKLDWIEGNTLEEMKANAFDGDCTIDVVEIK